MSTPAILVEVFMNYILVKNTYFMDHIYTVNKHKTMVLKPGNKYQII